MSVVPDLSNLILGSFPIESPHLKSSMERALYSGSRQDRVTRFWAVLQRQKYAAQEIYNYIWEIHIRQKKEWKRIYKKANNFKYKYTVYKRVYNRPRDRVIMEIRKKKDQIRLVNTQYRCAFLQLYTSIQYKMGDMERWRAAERENGDIQ
jgi:hypothetical protein